jgi:hypothetical protein
MPKVYCKRKRFHIISATTQTYNNRVVQDVACIVKNDNGVVVTGQLKCDKFSIDHLVFDNARCICGDWIIVSHKDISLPAPQMVTHCYDDLCKNVYNFEDLYPGKQLHSSREIKSLKTQPDYQYFHAANKRYLVSRFFRD